jgi:hypothetical protein
MTASQTRYGVKVAQRSAGGREQWQNAANLSVSWIGTIGVSYCLTAKQRDRTDLFTDRLRFK